MTLSDTSETTETQEFPKPEPREREAPTDDGWGNLNVPHDADPSDGRLESPSFDIRHAEAPESNDGWGDVPSTRLPPRLEVDASGVTADDETQDGWGAKSEKGESHPGESLVEAGATDSSAAETSISSHAGQAIDAGKRAEIRIDTTPGADLDTAIEDDPTPDRPRETVAREAVNEAFEPPYYRLAESENIEELPVSQDDIATRTTDNRINLADNVPSTANSPEYGGYLDVVMHGDETGTQAAVAGQSKDFTLEETAKMIESSPSWEQRPIRLMSCSTGKENYAQHLANRLDVPVYAPSDILDVRPNGELYIYRNGAWRRFEPVIR